MNPEIVRGLRCIESGGVASDGTTLSWGPAAPGQARRSRTASATSPAGPAGLNGFPRSLSRMLPALCPRCPRAAHGEALWIEPARAWICDGVVDHEARHSRNTRRRSRSVSADAARDAGFVLWIVVEVINCGESFLHSARRASCPSQG